MGQIERAMTPGGSHKDDEAKDLALNAGLAFVHAINPRNELEAVLATQMLAAHEAAMEMLRWTRTAEMVPHMESAGRLAVKLLKTFTAQVDTLKRYRSEGSQTVRVEHVNVANAAPGSTVVMGDAVQNVGPREGGGGGQQNGHQPHEQGSTCTIEHVPSAPGAPLRSQDQSRDAMPVSGHEGQEALS
jgi:hypothetical protein